MTPAIRSTGVFSNAFWALLTIVLVTVGCNFQLGKNSTSDSGIGSSSASPSYSPAGESGSEAKLPPIEDITRMVKDTTAEFADSVESGNFESLYENASPDFQTTFTLDQLTEAFKSYTEKRSIVVPILRKVQDANAEFQPTPRIRNEQGLDILVATGKFPTAPYNVRFDYEYVHREGEWKLLKLVVNMP
jgi:hypothetical protein